MATETADTRQAARKDLLTRIQNLEIAKQCLEQNLLRLRQELNDIHQHSLELGRTHQRSHTGTGRMRRLVLPSEPDFIKALDDCHHGGESGGVDPSETSTPPKSSKG